jgi:hypothetical protein
MTADLAALVRRGLGERPPLTASYFQPVFLAKDTK